MMPKNLGLVLAAMSLVFAPVAAQAEVSAKPINTVSRSATLIEDKSELAGGGVIIALIAGGLAALSIYLIADEDDSPASP